MYSWGTERDWAHIWTSSLTPAGCAGCRHHQPSCSAVENFTSTHHRPCQSVLAKGATFRDALVSWF